VLQAYPSPATAVKFAVLTDCQSVPATILPLAPKLIDVPLIVIFEFASLALAIEPANLSFAMVRYISSRYLSVFYTF